LRLIDVDRTSQEELPNGREDLSVEMHGHDHHLIPQDLVDRSRELLTENELGRGRSVENEQSV